MSVYVKINEYYTKAFDIALGEVEHRARQILEENKFLHEFVMGMGTWCFWDKEDRQYGSDYSFTQSITDIMNEWDDYLKLTGEPMRIKRDEVM